MIRLLCILLLLAAPLLGTTPAQAHFLLNLNVRIFHVDHRQDGLELSIRTPMPYLVADQLGESVGDALPTPAPFTTNAMESGKLVHFVDADALERQPLGLGQRLAEGLRLQVDGQRVELRVIDARVYRLGTEPGFATQAEATEAFDQPQQDLRDAPLYVGDAVVDVRLRAITQTAVSRYTLAGALDPGLPDQDNTANLLLDYGPGGVKVFRARGLMAEPIAVTRSATDAFATFVGEGIRHILEGLDHVLFVLCLAAGAFGLPALLWRVTGFTLGHSVTLSLGFFGFAPQATWFVPGIEWLIAVTIIYAALVVWRPSLQGSSERRLFFVTALIGLVHGLGFSFVLQHILKVTSPNIWQSLLAFNVGIEVGQVLLVVATLTIIAVADRLRPGTGRTLRLGIATIAAAVASYWVFERSLLLAAAL